MTVANFLKLLPFYEEVVILDCDNKVLYHDCSLTVPCEYYQHEVRTVFSYNPDMKRKSCICIVIK